MRPGAARCSPKRRKRRNDLMMKHYQVSAIRDGKKIHMNHFIQELTASTLVGLLGSLSALEENWKDVTLSIERLSEPREVAGRESK
jgi:hypothetical protein